MDQEPIDELLQQVFFRTSDAAFADEPYTRRSLQGYLFKLFRMSVDWKAAIQRTVTKSTTEAELLALLLAGGELQEWNRFFKNISFNPGIQPSLLCDNQQTVSIVTMDSDKLSTKLKHVDIHQMWLRQEATHGRLTVDWIPTDQMPADGLTKILPRQNHERFVKQLGLVDIRDRLQQSLISPSVNCLPEDYSNWY